MKKYSGFDSNITSYRCCLLFCVLLFCTVLVTADATEQPSFLSDFLKDRIESASFDISLYVYKPQLEQFTDLLNGLGAPEIGAVLMPFASITLKHTPELSSRLEIGYGSISTELPPPNSADLWATFIPVAWHLLYRPVLLHDFIPIYVGGGVGYSHLSTGGSALTLLEAQGITVDGKNSGLTGYLLIGYEHRLHEDRLSLNFEAKHILKTFVVSETPPLELDFDGTALGISVGLKF